jgi:hypothetical protein
MKTVMYTFLALTVFSVVWGLWAKNPQPIAQQAQPLAPGVDPPPVVQSKPDGAGVKVQNLIPEEKFKSGLGEAYIAGQQGSQQSYTVSTGSSGKGWEVQKDNRGNAEITFSIPGAPAIIETGLWCKGGQAFYVSTNSRHIPGFQAGFAENKKFSPGPAPAWEYAQPQGCRTRFDDNDPTYKIELAFYTAAIPPGHYRVSVRHSGVALDPLEFQPGVPLARVYGY